VRELRAGLDRTGAPVGAAAGQGDRDGGGDGGAPA
jgi:hypothetical protein